MLRQVCHVSPPRTPPSSAGSSRALRSVTRGFISFSEVANVPGQQGDQLMARAKKRRAWTTQDVRALKTHSKNKTSVKAISRTMKRTPAAVRQKAQRLGIALGHRR